MLAHEVPEVLPVAPWPGVAVALLLTVGLWLPARGRAHPMTTGPSLLTGRITAWVALVLGLLLVAVARTGPEDELVNPVPALVVGLGWPLLFLLPLALRPRAGPPGPHVWPAAASAVAVAVYLSLVPDRTTPRVLAAALASYLLAQVAVGPSAALPWRPPSPPASAASVRCPRCCRSPRPPSSLAGCAGR